MVGYRQPPQQWVQLYTQTTYDALGRTTTVQAPDPNSHTSFAYSITATAGQSQVVRTDALGHTTTTLSDSLGRAVQVSPHPGMGPSVSYQYDALDKLTQAARGGATTTLLYDLAGRKTQMTDPDMGTWVYSYDTLGNLIKQTDAKGQRTCLYYEILNRMVGKFYQTSDTCPTSPSYAVQYHYDDFNPLANQYGIGKRTVMTDTVGTTSRVFDSVAG